MCAASWLRIAVSCSSADCSCAAALSAAAWRGGIVSWRSRIRWRACSSWRRAFPALAAWRKAALMMSCSRPKASPTLLECGRSARRDVRSLHHLRRTGFEASPLQRQVSRLISHEHLAALEPGNATSHRRIRRPRRRDQLIGDQFRRQNARDREPRPSTITWDLATSKRTLTLAAEKGWISDVAFSSDDLTLIYSVMDGWVKLWDIKENCLRNSSHNPGGFAGSISISPDGKTIAAAQIGLVLWQFGQLRQPLEQPLIQYWQSRMSSHSAAATAEERPMYRDTFVEAFLAVP